MQSGQLIHYHIQPGGKMRGTIRIPGDKSISHRALMLAAIADGKTRIDGFLHGEDTLATLMAMRSMGVQIEQTEQSVGVYGVGLHGLHAPSAPLDLGNSGTSARLLAGLLAGQPFDSTIVGDASLMRRPMRRIIEPLSLMNADVHASDKDTLPIHIHGGRQLHAIDYTMPVGSAQLKSCLLLAGLYADGISRIHEPVITRDHTERMLQHFGCTIEKYMNTVSLFGGQVLTAANVCIPGDISSAAFFMVGASIARGSDIHLQNVGVNPTRDAVIHILKAMGADIELTGHKMVSGEPVADIRVKAAPLHGITIPLTRVALAIDEFPAIMVAAACAEGKTVLHGADELRVKESDRIESIAAGLRAIGTTVETFDDGMEVTGGAIDGGVVDSFTDHRIAMAFAMIGLRATDTVTVRNCANVNTSFPGFVEIASAAGLSIKQDATA
ncbi:MAG TPA: 3-phosphoshikimate 1-carboxyvinyltransferase [Gammaproteobacteria bacterium]|nr:3-phosphoshikimate 1-carboxyvinyltransferase [Gammaproteobacteria bacterium]